jgi:hypothetical protein
MSLPLWPIRSRVASIRSSLKLAGMASPSVALALNLLERYKFDVVVTVSRYTENHRVRLSPCSTPQRKPLISLSFKETNRGLRLMKPPARRRNPSEITQLPALENIQMISPITPITRRAPSQTPALKISPASSQPARLIIKESE